MIPLFSDRQLKENQMTKLDPNCRWGRMEIELTQMWREHKRRKLGSWRVEGWITWMRWTRRKILNYVWDCTLLLHANFTFLRSSSLYFIRCYNLWCVGQNQSPMIIKQRGSQVWTLVYVLVSKNIYEITASPHHNDIIEQVDVTVSL